MADKVDIAVVTRTYQGLEGHRVKAGTRFAIGRELHGLPVITKARFQTLLQSKLVRPFGSEDTVEQPRHERPLARTVTTMEGTGGPTARAIRAASRARVKQTDTPGAPKQLKGPAAKSTSPGSQTGAGAGSSSSAAAPASTTSTSGSSKKRGQRGAAPAAPPPSASSPSTTR